MRVRIARDELRRLRELTATINSLGGEIAGADRFASDAKLATAAGIAPIPASSDRHRLDRGGNRQINAAIHRIAVTRARCDPQTQDDIARKKAEGKTNPDAIRGAARGAVCRSVRLPTPRCPDRVEQQSRTGRCGSADAGARGSVGLADALSRAVAQVAGGRVDGGSS
jgi:Transposase IS116/IS110/IS902 family